MAGRDVDIAVVGGGAMRFRTRRARVLAWLGRELARFGTTMAALPDPQGQFPAVPLLWHVPESQIPAQPDGPPPGHPERRFTVY